MSYFIDQKGSIQGPYPLEHIKEMLESGSLRRDDKVCPVGADTWIPVAQAMQKNEASIDQPPVPGARSRRKGCLGRSCLLTGLVIFVLTIGGVWFSVNRIIWHSSLPLKLVAHLLNSDDQLEIEGISGSLSKGITVRHVSYRHDDGQISFVEDAGFRHNPIREIFSKECFILYDLHAKRAHLYLSTSSEETSEDAADTEFESLPEGEASEPARDDAGLKLFEIRNVRIEDVVIEDKTSGKKLAVDTLHLSGFKVDDKGVSIGELTLKCNALDLSVPPVSMPLEDGQIVEAQFPFSGAVKPDLIKDLEDAVTFAGQVIVQSNALHRMEVFAFDEGLKIAFQAEQHADRFAVRADRLQLRRYLPLIPVDDLTGAFSVEPTDTDTARIALSEGGFDLGVARFHLEPKTEEIGEEHVDPVIFVAQADAGDVTYRIELFLNPSATGTDGMPQADLRFSSVPDKSPNEMWSGLLFGSAYQDLSAEDKERVDAQVERFHAEESVNRDMDGDVMK